MHQMNHVGMLGKCILRNEHRRKTAENETLQVRNASPGIPPEDEEFASLTEEELKELAQVVIEINEED